MSIPDPQPGLVIGYSYLWQHEDAAGEIEGRKDRPCAIVSAVERDGDNALIVTVLPITHTPPSEPDSAVELPQKTKARLGLDNERSWIVCSEVNKFLWPGPDLRPVSRQQRDRFEYGFLPPSLFIAVRNKVTYLARGRVLRIVKRVE